MKRLFLGILRELVRDEKKGQTRRWAWWLIWLLIREVKLVPTSSDAIIYRVRDGNLEILVGIRHGETENGGLSIAPGGFSDPNDATLAQTAEREALEETGLTVEAVKLLTITGPKRFKACAYPIHGTRPQKDFKVLATEEELHPISMLGCRVVAAMYAAKVRSGKPMDTMEQTHSRWMSVDEVVEKHGRWIVFDQALGLKELVRQWNAGEL